MRGEIQDEGAVRVARTLPNCEMAADDCESHIRMALPKSLELSPVAATFASQLRSPRSVLAIALNFPARHLPPVCALAGPPVGRRSEEHTSELQSQSNLVCRLRLEKKKKNQQQRLDENKKKKVRDPDRKDKH